MSSLPRYRSRRARLPRAKFFGYYGQYPYTDKPAAELDEEIQPIPQRPIRRLRTGQTGTVSFSLANNLEMKVKSDNDSIGEKKISLIENLNIRESYNFAADSLRWSDLSTSILLRLTKGFNLNLSATWDLYTYGLNAVGTPVSLTNSESHRAKGLDDLMRTGTSFSYTFNNDTFKQEKKTTNRKRQQRSGGFLQRRRCRNATDATRKNGDNSTDISPDGYAKWSGSLEPYLQLLRKLRLRAFNKQKMEFDGKITQNLSLSGNLRPTPTWNFSFSASYNFDQEAGIYELQHIARPALLHHACKLCTRRPLQELQLPYSRQIVHAQRLKSTTSARTAVQRHRLVLIFSEKTRAQV